MPVNVLQTDPLRAVVPSPYEVAAQTLRRFATEVAQQVKPSIDNRSGLTFLPNILQEAKALPDRLTVNSSDSIPNAYQMLTKASPTANRALDKLIKESDLFGVGGAVSVPEATFVKVWNKLPKLAETIATKYHLNADTAIVDDLVTAASESITPRFAEGIPEGLGDVESFLTNDATAAMVEWARKHGHVPTHVSMTSPEGYEGVVADALTNQNNVGRVVKESNEATAKAIDEAGNVVTDVPDASSIASSAPTPIQSLASIFRGDKTKSFLKKTLLQGKSQTHALRELGYDLYRQTKPQTVTVDTLNIPRYSQIALRGGVPTGNVMRGATAKGRELVNQVQEALYGPLSQQLESKLGRVPTETEVRSELFNMLHPATQLKRANLSQSELSNAINKVLDAERSDSPLRVVFGGRMNLQARSEALPVAKRQKFLATAVDPAALYLLEGRSPLEIARRVGIPTSNTTRIATFSKHLENLTNKVFAQLGIDRSTPFK